MTETVDISTGFNSQLVQGVQFDQNRIAYEHPTPLPPRHGRAHLRLGFLTSALAASSDPRLPWDQQPSATAVIYQHDADGNLVENADQTEVTIYSRRDTAFLVDTFVEFVWKWGKWQLTDANCAATDLTVTP